MSAQFTVLNPNYKELIVEKLIGQRFMHHIGFELDRIEPGLVTAGMLIEEHILQQTNFVHGGATSTLADLVMGFAAYTLVDVGQVVLTADLRVSYLNPGQGDKITAKGFVIKAGRKMIFCESEVYCEKKGVQTIIAKASATMCVVNLIEIGL
ncbi:MAG: PaaI family thioesterase [Bacteroidota bacterium]|nr:PaaI family thioesterase [Bacteroidota bacterium]